MMTTTYDYSKIILVLKKFCKKQSSSSNYHLNTEFESLVQLFNFCYLLFFVHFSSIRFKNHIKPAQLLFYVIN